jgi:hypothetical protein
VKRTQPHRQCHFGQLYGIMSLSSIKHADRLFTNGPGSDLVHSSTFSTARSDLVQTGVVRAIARALEDASSLDLDYTADFDDLLTQEMQPVSPCPRGGRSCSTISICRESLSDTDIDDDLSEETHTPLEPDAGNHLWGATKRRLRSITYYGKRPKLSMIESNISFFQKNRRKSGSVKTSMRPFPVPDLSSPCPRSAALVQRQALP